MDTDVVSAIDIGGEPGTTRRARQARGASGTAACHGLTGLLRRALAAMGVGATLCVGVGADGASGASLGPAIDAAKAPQPDEEVLEAGDYLLRTRILHAGTRSEGRIGRLFHRGIEVPGRTPGQTLDAATPAGTVRFTYLGEARPHLWSVSGWTDRRAP